ncbi:MAG: Trm112 family protein [Candidatus Woesearchaeota archaeon]
MAEFDKRILDLLQCPKCGSSLEMKGKKNLFCQRCKKEFEIRNGIPILLPDTVE